MESKTLHILYSGLGGTTNYVVNWIKAAEKTEKVDCLFYGIENLNQNTKEQFEQLGSSVYFVKKESKIDFKGYQKIKKILETGYKNIILHIDSLILPISRMRLKDSNLIAVEHQANHLKDRRRWFWSRLYQKKADCIVCLTQEYQDELKHKLKNFKPEKNQVIRTGIDIQHYNSNSPKTPKLYGAVGRLNSQRDFKTLIQVFNDLDDSFQLEIAGDGEDLLELKKIANQNITFLGELDDKEFVQFLNKISVFLKPSFGETSSPAIMEAQAAGLPIIGWNVKGVKNVLNENNAILVEPKDIKSLKDAVLKLSGEDEESLNKLSKLGMASLKFAQENLSHVRMYNEYKALLK